MLMRQYVNNDVMKAKLLIMNFFDFSSNFLRIGRSINEKKELQNYIIGLPKLIDIELESKSLFLHKRENWFK